MTSEGVVTFAAAFADGRAPSDVSVVADPGVVATGSEGRADGEAAATSAAPSRVLSGSALSGCAFFAVVFLAAAGLDVVLLALVVPFDGAAADAAAPAAGDAVLRGVVLAVEDPDAPAFASAVFDAVVFDAAGFVSVAFAAAGLEDVVLAAALFDAAVVDPEAFGVALLAAAVLAAAVLAAAVLAAAVFDAAVVLLAAAEVLVVFFAAGRDVEDAGSPCPAAAVRSSTDAPSAPAVVARAAAPCVFRTGVFRAGAFLSAAFSAAGDAVPAVRAEAVPRAGAFFVGRDVVEPPADAVVSRPEAFSDGLADASDAGVGLWSSDGFEGAEVTRRIYQDGAFSARHRMTSTSWEKPERRITNRQQGHSDPGAIAPTRLTSKMA